MNRVIYDTLERLERYAPYAPSGELIRSQLEHVFAAGESRGRSIWWPAALGGFSAGILLQLVLGWLLP